MSNAAQTAPTNKPKRERKPATPPTKLEAAAKIGKILRTFSAEERQAILAFVVA
jgi:hypothetical protein